MPALIIRPGTKMRLESLGSGYKIGGIPLRGKTPAKHIFRLLRTKALDEADPAEALKKLGATLHTSWEQKSHFSDVAREVVLTPRDLGFNQKIQCQFGMFLESLPENKASATEFSRAGGIWMRRNGSIYELRLRRENTSETIAANEKLTTLLGAETAIDCLHFDAPLRFYEAPNGRIATSARRGGFEIEGKGITFLNLDTVLEPLREAFGSGYQVSKDFLKNPNGYSRQVTVPLTLKGQGPEVRLRVQVKNISGQPFVDQRSFGHVLAFLLSPKFDAENKSTHPEVEIEIFSKFDAVDGWSSRGLGPVPFYRYGDIAKLKGLFQNLRTAFDKMYQRQAEEFDGQEAEFRKALIA